jgi:hypothetical protein
MLMSLWNKLHVNGQLAMGTRDKEKQGANVAG